MLVLLINHVCNWVQITTGGRCYTCPMTKQAGKMLFRFKGKWHPVVQYASQRTRELTKIDLGLK